MATLKNILETARIRRREHFRTLSILCFPAPGVLASEVLAPIEPKLIALKKSLPPGYQLQIGGEKAKQVDGFTNLAVVLLISLVGIYLALLVQFNNAVKPLLVFAAAPYGVIGALIALSIMRTPFGFMAFLGVASLIGVIVSHVIVLFDFIEEMHQEGESLERALPDAGIERIRPVIWHKMLSRNESRSTTWIFTGQRSRVGITVRCKSTWCVRDSRKLSFSPPTALTFPLPRSSTIRPWCLHLDILATQMRFTRKFICDCWLRVFSSYRRNLAKRSRRPLAFFA